MEKETYFCCCSNVIINTNCKDTLETSGKHLIEMISTGDESDNIDPFFYNMLLDVRLAISGIELYHPFLSRERSFGDWSVLTCLNCGMDTHAVHSMRGNDRVLLSKALFNGIEKLKEIKDSSSYSTFLKIKLLEPSQRVNNKAAYLTSSKLMAATQKLENTAKKFIQIEKDMMKERIRVFTEKEHQKFHEFEENASKDKDNVLRNLQHLTTSDTFSESYFGLADVESRDVHMELPSIKVTQGSMMLSAKQKVNPTSLHEQLQALPAGKKGMLNIPNSSSLGQQVESSKKNNLDTDDILFDLEGYHNCKNDEPFFESDDESSGDANSFESSGGFSSNTRGANLDDLGGNAGDRVYATSLPVPVPLFNNVRLSYDSADNDDESKNSPNLNQIAASFKAVAKSMQDSTGMFGDLPPRRIFADRNMGFGQL